MKSTIDKICRDELIRRINTLNEKNSPQWGKMNVYQMLKHCQEFEAMALGKKKYSHSFIGRLFGKMVLKNVLKDDRPLKRNTPTVPDFKIKEIAGDIPSQKRKWIALIEGYEHLSNPNFIHPFFGKMTEEQIGYLSYKHTDHHLRQFNS